VVVVPKAHCALRVGVGSADLNSPIAVRDWVPVSSLGAVVLDNGLRLWVVRCEVLALLGSEIGMVLVAR
jgi:hypothetical protein